MYRRRRPGEERNEMKNKKKIVPLKCKDDAKHRTLSHAGVAGSKFALAHTPHTHTYTYLREEQSRSESEPFRVYRKLSVPITKYTRLPNRRRYPDINQNDFNCRWTLLCVDSRIHLRRSPTQIDWFVYMARVKVVRCAIEIKSHVSQHFLTHK